MKVRFFNIEWNTDGEELNYLPTDLVLDIPEDESELDLELAAIILYDKFTFDVFKVDYEIIHNSTDDLIDAVIEQIISDVKIGDYTAIEELLKTAPREQLKSFLSDIDKA